MLSNLVGQYVVSGYGENKQSHEIVAVYLERGELLLLARNPENRLNQYNADGCVVVKESIE